MMTHHSNLSERDLELLSAYLDGELTDPERHAIEQRLASESDLRRALDDLHATVRLVGALPRLKAPRSFALDPALYGARIPWWRRWLASGAALQWSGALGAAASVVLIALGLTLSSGDKMPDREAAAPAPTPSIAPVAALLPTPQPSPSFSEMLDAAPPPASEAEAQKEQARAGQAVEAPVEAPEAMLAAPQAAPPVPLGDAADQPFAGAEAFAPPVALSPDAALRSAPPAESFEPQGAAEDREEGAGSVSMTVMPTATQPSTPTTEPVATTATDQAAGATNAAQKAQDDTARETTGESGLRWWLVGVGTAGLALSAALFLLGSRQAGA